MARDTASVGWSLISVASKKGFNCNISFRLLKLKLHAYFLYKIRPVFCSFLAKWCDFCNLSISFTSHCIGFS